MKVAVTADVHIRKDKPERLDNFQNILKSLQDSGISTLIVAGDLCDDDSDSPLLVDKCLEEFPGVKVLAIPGNHDHFLSGRLFSAGNITVYEKPEAVEMGERTFLFLPYHEGETMGGIIEKEGLQSSLDPDDWILVSHGDHGRINRDASGHEYGYFPLAGNDIELFRPARVILGHIHVPGPVSETVVYAGSPWPLDINETGQRRLLVLDTASAHLAPLPLVDTPVYSKIECVLIPDGNEEEQLKEQIKMALDNEARHYTGKNIYEKLIVRVQCSGYVTSRETILDEIKKTLTASGIDENRVEKMDIDNLRVAESEEHLLLAEKVNQYIQSLHLSGDTDAVEALKPEITTRAYRILFGN